jgi:outer membrane protein assembly factor BamB
MRRALGTCFVCCALLLSLTCSAQHAQAPVVQDFSFLVVTDTHQTANGSTEPLSQLVTAATQSSTPPAFIIDTGDVTEAGRPEEYARFKEAISGLAPAHIAFYAVPGNHDVRWSPNGKLGFEEQFGKRYQSFDYGGIHFVLLDTTVLLEHWGHLDQAELDWLSKDMKKVKPETPVMLFMHHWIGRDVPSVRPIDDEFALWPPLRDHNVVAIFTGHGHSDLFWRTNGVATFMARGLYQGSYHRVNVTPLLAHIKRIVKEKPDPVDVTDIALSRKDHPSELQVAWDDPDVPFLARRRPMARLEPRSIDDNPDKETGEYRVDDGPWKPMTKDARDIWRDTFPTAGLSIGVHSADIRITTSNGRVLTNEAIFEVERDEKEATRKWAMTVEAPIQSSPVLVHDMLYVTSIDGRVSAIEAAKGHRKWFCATHGPITGSVTVEGQNLYVGSSDHDLYCIDRGDGHVNWHTDVGAPIWATPAVAQGIVCVGAAGKIVGIDISNGKIKWSQPAGSFFQSRAATDGTSFYLGGWDNALYALNATDGTVRWKAPMGKTQSGKGSLSFYFSPAISSPMVLDGRVYVCTDDGLLHAVDASNGMDVWAVHSPQGGDTFGYSSPVIANGRIYVAGLGDHGDVYALDASTGSLIWQIPTGQTIYDSSPKLSPDGSSLAIMGVRGNVSVLDTGTGKKRWSYALGPGNIFSTPEYDGSVVYTTTMANDVQAIAAPTAGEAGK